MNSVRTSSQEAERARGRIENTVGINRMICDTLPVGHYVTLLAVYERQQQVSTTYEHLPHDLLNQA